MTSTPLSPQPEMVNWLSTRQYVRPHEPIAEVMQTFSALFAPGTPAQPLADIDPTTRIGRLSRAQIESIAVRLSATLARR